MRSTRAISWTWNRTVSRFSKSNVTSGPTATRRRLLQLDDLTAIDVAPALVGAEILDVVDNEGAVHDRTEPPSGIPDRPEQLGPVRNDPELMDPELMDFVGTAVRRRTGVLR
jgi:hypothetical protein